MSRSPSAISIVAKVNTGTSAVIEVEAALARAKA